MDIQGNWVWHTHGQVTVQSQKNNNEIENNEKNPDLISFLKIEDEWEWDKN